MDCTAHRGKTRRQHQDKAGGISTDCARREEYKATCDDDVRVYLRSILAPRFKDEGSLITAIDTIATKSEELFLYLHYMRTMLQSGRDIDTLQSGFAGIYQQHLEHVLGPARLGVEMSQTHCL